MLLSRACWLLLRRNVNWNSQFRIGGRYLTDGSISGVNPKATAQRKSCRKVFKGFTVCGHARKYLWNEVFSKMAYGTPVTDPEIITLLRQHPRKNIDAVHSVVWKSRREGNRPEHGSLYFRRTPGGKEEDVSYVACLRNFYGLKDRRCRVTDAFRDAVYDTPKKRNFYGAHCGEPCSECAKRPGHTVAHHSALPFREVMDKFLTTKSLNKNDIAVFERDDNLYDFSSATLKKEWVSFHQSTVVYRIICGKCNIAMLGMYNQRRAYNSISSADHD